MLIFFAILTAVAATACYFTERRDRPMRRAERIAAQARREALAPADAEAA